MIEWAQNSASDRTSKWGRFPTSDQVDRLTIYRRDKETEDDDDSDDGDD